MQLSLVVFPVECLFFKGRCGFLFEIQCRTVKPVPLKGGCPEGKGGAEGH